MKKQNIIIIGGGIIGMGAAWELVRNPDYQVTIIEKQSALGGMSSGDSIGQFHWDRYYHVLLSRDSETLQLISELGLDDKLFWTTSKSGFFGNNLLVSLSGAFDFITFPFLSLFQKARLVFGILFTSLIKDGSKLEKQYVRTWMTKVFGRRVYERIWDPLLRSKLGKGKEETSAVFIWATIKRLYGARSDSADKQEKMGHVKGGYAQILQIWEEELIKKGVEIIKNKPVLSIDTNNNIVNTLNYKYNFDQILITTPSPIAVDLLGKILPEGDYKNFLTGQKYLGVICLRLLLKKSLSPYYVINLLDETLPFTGIIESTNVIGCDQVGGNHLVYLPRYSVEEDEFYKLDEKKIEQEFIDALQKVFPELLKGDIIASALSVERFVQPLYTLDYGNRIPSISLPAKDIYLANTSMIKNATLNNNAALRLAKEAVKEMVTEEVNSVYS